MYDALIVGHISLDLIPAIPLAAAQAPSFLQPGRLAETGPLMITTGGVTTNTGFALHQLGLNVALVGRLGDDASGDMVKQVIAARDPRLTEHLVTIPGESSPYTFVINPPGVDRTFLHGPGANDSFGPEDVSDALLAQTRLMHMGYPPLMRRMHHQGGRELETLFCRAKAAGAITSLDTSMPDPTTSGGKADWAEILSRVLPHVDLFQPSVEELLLMLRRKRFDQLTAEVGHANLIDAVTIDDISSLAEQSLDWGARIVALKLGHRGLYLRSDDELVTTDPRADAARDWASREMWAPCFDVEVVGTVGSGDSTIAGMLAGLIKGQSAQKAILTAVAVGACNVEAADSISGILNWQDTQNRIRRGWAQQIELANAPGEEKGWHYCDATRLWHGPHDRLPRQKEAW